jgi:RHS repeat-associated protein
MSLKRAISLLALVVACLAIGPGAADAASGETEQNAHPGEITKARPGFVAPGKRSGNAAPLASPSATAFPSTPFTECPPVGADTSCALLIYVTDSGVTILQDPSQGPYDGVEDTLIGVLNQSSKDLGHLSLGSNTDMFGFDGDGICAYQIDLGCPFGPTGYEGPGVSFTEISADVASGVVNFEPPVPPGGTRYFSLEEPLSASTVVSGGPSPLEQGGAPNRSEKRTTCSKGHPVNCATGVFWHEFIDARVPGRGVPLEFARTYSSMNAGEDGPLGFGWSDSYGMSLSIDGETGAANIREEGGSAVTFPANGEGGFTTPARVLAKLEANEDGTYTFSRFSQHIDYVFSAEGRLLREVDRNGNATTLSYSGGLLQAVTDPSGRSLTFSYAGSHIHTLTDPLGRTTTFSYDANGNLKEATDPMGRTWTFGYDGSHRLLTMTDPRGGTVSNTYDGAGRVIAQTDAMGRESSWQYEGEATGPEGGTTTFTNARGDVTRYGYRDLELRSVTRGVGTGSEATTSYSYDAITLGVTTITDPDGHVTHNHYDSHGNLIESIDPMGRASYHSFGPDDEMLSFSDPRGTTTEYRYDAAGNPLEKVIFDFETGEPVATTYGYAGEPGDLTSVTDPLGHTTSFGYDNAGNRTSVTDADGNEVTYAYDADGELTSEVSPAGNAPGGNPSQHTTSYAYDADGELTGETDPLGHATSYSYDGNGNRTTIADAKGHTTHLIYDADNEPIEVIRPDGSILKTTWDTAGNMTAQIDAAGQATTYAYDPIGRVVSRTEPNGHTTSYGYDPAGNRTSVTNPEGEVTSYEYDADNELISIFYSAGQTPPVFEEYDASGNRVRLTDGTGTSTFTYDSFNRMTSATDGAGATVEYEYDLAGQLTKLTYPNGQSVTRAFDPAGNLTAVSDWLGHTTHFSYDADLNLSKEAYGNGVTARIAYDDADQPTSIATSVGATQLASFDYSRDPLGQVTSEINKNGVTETIGYSRNSLDQLTAANSTPYGYDAADNPTTFGQDSQQFDVANELTSVSGPGEAEEEEEEVVVPTPGSGSPAGGGAAASPGAAPPAISPPKPKPRKALHCRRGFKKVRVHGKARCVRRKKHRRAHTKARAATRGRPGLTAAPAANTTAANGGPPQGSQPVRRVLSEITRNLAYNQRGDRISEGLSGGGTRFLSYDQADRLTGIDGSIAYAYNGDGLRVSKTIGGVVSAEVWNQAESLPELLESGSTSYVYGPGGQPIEQIVGGAATFMHSDQQGSIRLLTDAGGNPVGRYDYDAWGAVVRHTGSVDSELQFDGQLTDAETGYQYLRARYYDPATGQFLSPDPLQQVSRSRYGYAENDPLTFGDSSGEIFGVDTLLGGAIGAIVGTVAGAGSYGASVIAGHEKFSWRGLGASTAGGLVGGAFAGACGGTTWVGVVGCGAVGGALASGITQSLGTGHLPSAGDLMVGGLVGAVGGGLGKLLYPLRGFVPYKLSNVFKPGINALREYGQNAVSGVTGIVSQLLWC